MSVVSVDYRLLQNSPHRYDGAVRQKAAADSDHPVDVHDRLARDVADTRAELEKQVEVSSALLVEVQIQVPQQALLPGQDPAATIALCIFGVYSTLQQALRRVEQRDESRQELIEAYIAQHPEYDEEKLRAYLYGIAFE